MKKKMTIGQKIKFMITGKYPDEAVSLESKPEEISESSSFVSDEEKEKESSKNIFSDESEKISSQHSEISAEEKFEKETGMPLKKAESLLQKWGKNNETEKIKKGKKLILEYFPHYFDKNSSEKKEDTSSQKNDKLVSEHQKDATPEKSRSESNQKKNKEKQSIPEKKTSKFDRKKFIKKLADNPMKAIGVSFDPQEENLPDENSIEDDERLFGAIAYVPFFSVFVIAMKKESAFAQYHAWQAFTILVFLVAITAFGWIFSFLGISFLAHIVDLFLFIAAIIASFAAFRGRYIFLPFISSMAKTLSGR